MSETTRRCSQCRDFKALEKFGRYKYGRNGRRAYCKACRSEYDRRYRQENKATVQAKNVRRRALKLGLTPDWCAPGTEAYVDIQAVYSTAEALSDATGLEFHVDHIVSFANGGEHRPDNLQPLRADQNIEKSSNIDWTAPSPTFMRVTFVARIKLPILRE